MKNIGKQLLVIIMSFMLVILLNSCSSASQKVTAIDNFNINNYLGTWYEIARFDFVFEKDLDNVSAQYILNKNGTITVINSGFNKKKNNWKKAEGVAKFRGDKNMGKLKVSFFGPFYSDYNIIAIDDEYKYALIAGKNLNYLWILSRSKSIPNDVKTNLLKIAKDNGYNTSNLLWINHDKNDNPYLRKSN